MPDDGHSYANFGRFAMGMWWQPHTLCLRDMWQFMRFERTDIPLCRPDRCLCRVEKVADDPISFRRGLADAAPRSFELKPMAPK